MPKRKFICDPYLKLYLPLYELDGNSFMSRDAYGHLCTVTDATWGLQGRNFNGTSAYIDCGNNASLSGMTTLTIEVWINPTALAATDALVVGKSGSYYISFKSTQTDVALWKNPNATYVSTLIVSTNTWSHFAFTWDGTNISIYDNGVLHQTAAFAGVSIATGLNLAIGAYADASNLFTGVVGEVRIYSRDLTPQEVQRNYLMAKDRYQ